MSKPYIIQFGEVVKKAREKAGLSQEQLATEIGFLAYRPIRRKSQNN